MHFQNDPTAQVKLVHVLRGAVLDVAVDLRKDSRYYLMWVGIELSAENKRMLFILCGFAHGFMTLTEDVDFFYKVDNPYSPAFDRSIRFNHPAIAVGWSAGAPFLFDKDKNALLLKNSYCGFKLFTKD